MAAILRITVDANILHALHKPEYLIHPVVAAIWRYREKGLLDIRATHHIAVDIPAEPLKSRIETIPVLADPDTAENKGADPRTGEIQGADPPQGSRQPLEWRHTRMFRNLRDLIFPGAVPSNAKEPNRLRDIGHLLAHRRAGRDIFLTGDKAILGRKEQLRERYGIVAMHPEELLEQLRRASGRDG